MEERVAHITTVMRVHLFVLMRGRWEGGIMIYEDPSALCLATSSLPYLSQMPTWFNNSHSFN